MDELSSVERTLRKENAELRARLAEAEEMLGAIRAGEVDALVIESAGGPQIFTLQGLDAQAARFRGDIIAQVSEAVIATDGGRHVTYLNAAAERQYGVSASEALGRSLHEIFQIRWLAPGEENAAAAALRESGHWRGENIHIKRDGETIRVESSLSRLDTEDGAPGTLSVIRDVTERHRTEAARRESAEQLRLIADTAPVLIAHCDSEHRYKFVNAPYAAWLGMRREEILGRHIAEVIGATAYESIRPYIERVLRGEAVEFELTIPYEGLGTHHVRCAYAPEIAVDGTIIGLVGAIVDITERKRDEEALRENQARLNFTLEAAHIGDWDLDLATDTARRSARHDQVFGYSEPVAEWGFAKFLAHVHPDDRAEIQRSFREAVAQRKDMRFDCRVIWPDSSVHWIAGYGSIYRTPSGEPTRMLGIVSDITERKSNEALFSTIIEQAPGGVYVVDDRFRTLKVNALARPTFLAAEPVIGREFGEVMRILWGAELGEKLAEIFRHTLTTGERFVSPRFEEHREDLGVEKSYDWETQRIVLPNGKYGVVCYFTDTTELRAHELSLREAKDAAEAANASKDRFLAVLSHELRTPLTPVLMTVAALESDSTLPREVREDLAMMKRNIQLETKLIDDLLDLSRVTTGKLVLKIESINLNDAIRHVCGICEADLQARKLRLETELHSAPAPVAADSARLQQVLWNVLKNAIKFTPEGGMIRVTSKPLASGRWEVRVQDSGIGITAEALPKIFDAFEQGGAAVTRQFGGLGLGLAISKALVDLHAGAIRAESPGPGGGATFILEIPNAASARSLQIPEAANTESSPKQSVRVLIVENHPDTARTLSRLLNAAGFSTLTANSIAGAMMIAQREPFDVLVSDLGLPDGSGCDLMRRLSAVRPVCGIAISGYGMEEDLRLSREVGFAEHLVKPIDFQQLCTAIHRVSLVRVMKGS